MRASIVKLILLFLVSLGLYGCAVAPEKMDLDDASRARIHKIALLRIYPSQNVSVRNKSDVTSLFLFGAIPALIEENIVAEKSKKYLAEMQKKKISFASDLEAMVQRDLRKIGYDVTYIENQRPKLLADKKTADYSDIATDADAILNVYYGPIGYFSPPLKESYSPWVVVAVKLVDAVTKKPLFFKVFSVRPAADRVTDPNIDVISPDAKYQYRTFDDLMSNFDESIVGISDAQEKFSARLVQLLKK